MPYDARLNVYYIIELELKHSIALCKLVLSYLSSVSEDDEDSSFPRNMCDLVMSLLTISNEMMRDQALQTIKTIMSTFFKVTDDVEDVGDIRPSSITGAPIRVTSATPSSSVMDQEPLTYAQKLTHAACYMNNLTEPLIIACCEWCASTSNDFTQLGQSTLIQVCFNILLTASYLVFQNQVGMKF